LKIVIVKNLNLTENTTDPVKNEPLIDFHLILRRLSKLYLKFSYRYSLNSFTLIVKILYYNIVNNNDG